MTLLDNAGFTAVWARESDPNNPTTEIRQCQSLFKSHLQRKDKTGTEEDVKIDEYPKSNSATSTAQKKAFGI